MLDESSGWRWTFHYALSRKILVPSNLSASPDVKLVTNDDGNVIGFELGVRTTNDNTPEEYCNTRARTIVQLLTAGSEYAISSTLSGYKGVPSDPNRLTRVASISAHRYKIEGGALPIDNLDLTDTRIEGIISSSKKSNSLRHLFEAISHFCSDRYKECITAGFMVIEGNTTLSNYSKYRCIRDIVNHSEDQIWRPNTVDDFDKYFGPSVFDFKVPYDKTCGIIILDFESHKTIQMLKLISQDLITDAKSFLNL